VRRQHASKKQVPLWSLDRARANATPMDWSGYTPPAPQFTGRRVFQNIDLAELARFIDWGPFFQTWDLAGSYPTILQDEVVGEQARQVFADAQAMLKKCIAEKCLHASGVMGLYAANAVGDDIVLWADAHRTQPALTWHGLRQQTEKPEYTDEHGQTRLRPSRCLADFVAPLSASETEAFQSMNTSGEGQKSMKFSSPIDHVGVFAVTAGLGVEAKEAEFLAAHDDYNAILFKALADRLAEAAAEWLHWRVRTDLWGYAPHEALGNDELIAEKYQGIRPAPGYPACPDHTVKSALFALLGASDIGMGLTESLAMTPAASVSGFYLSHPEATYFNVGKVGEDQLTDMAARRHMPEAELRRWLSPNL